MLEYHCGSEWAVYLHNYEDNSYDAGCNSTTPTSSGAGTAGAKLKNLEMDMDDKRSLQHYVWIGSWVQNYIISVTRLRDGCDFSITIAMVAVEVHLGVSVKGAHTMIVRL